MIVTLEKQEDRAISLGRLTVTPVSQVLQIQVARLPIRIIWNRPIAVKVQTAEGEEQVLPVYDVTRLALLAMAVMTIVCLLIRWRKR